jgi:hypothetical protein
MYLQEDLFTAEPIPEGAGVKVRLVVGSERIKEMTGGGQGLIKGWRNNCAIQPNRDGNLF